MMKVMKSWTGEFGQGGITKSLPILVVQVCVPTCYLEIGMGNFPAGLTTMTLSHLHLQLMLPNLQLHLKAVNFVRIHGISAKYAERKSATFFVQSHIMETV